METCRLGVDAGIALREALRRGDPRRVVTEYQTRHGLDESLLDTKNSKGTTYQSILPLLDQHGVSRSEVYSGLLGELKGKLMDKAATLPEAKLHQLLDQCFQYIRVAELQPVVLETLKHTRNVPQVYLEHLATHNDLVALCPISTKRQVWALAKSLFRQHITPIIDAYVFDEALWESFREYRTEAAPSTAPNRRHQTCVQQLCEAIGASITLYNETLRLLRLYFVETGHPLLCALRADILMELHDADVVEIYKEDPCHMLAWSLDACVRHNSMEPRRVKEIQTFFDGITIESAYGDIAMIISDPLSFHMLAYNVIVLLHQRVETALSAKDQNEIDERLQWMIRLMNLGHGARSMIEMQKFKVPKLNPDLSKRLLQTILSCIRDHIARATLTKQLEAAAQAAADAAAAKSPTAPPPGPVTLTDEELPQPLAMEPSLVELLQEDSLARRLFNEYVMMRVRAKDHMFTKMVFKFLGSAIANDEDFLQSIGIALGQLHDNRLTAIVFETAFLPLAEISAAAHRQAINALSQVALRLPMSSVQEILNKLLDKGTRTDLHLLTRPYQKLLAKAPSKISSKVMPQLLEIVKEGDIIQKSKPLAERSVSNSNITIPAAVTSASTSASEQTTATPPSPARKRKASSMSSGSSSSRRSSKSADASAEDDEPVDLED